MESHNENQHLTELTGVCGGLFPRTPQCAIGYERLLEWLEQRSWEGLSYEIDLLEPIFVLRTKKFDHIGRRVGIFVDRLLINDGLESALMLKRGTIKLSIA